jgi:uncharacterized delta-60 repeat protein
MFPTLCSVQPSGFYWRRLYRRGLAAALLTFVAGGAVAAPQGSADTAFNGSGYVITDFHNALDEVYALAPLRDGRVLAAGSTNGPNAEGPGSSLNAVIARYLPNGTPDLGFATSGRFEFDLGGQTDEIRALKVLPDGHILAVGALTPKNDAYAQLALIRLDRNGQFDTTFGQPDGPGLRKGYTLLDVNGPGRHDYGVSVAVQSSGKIIVGATTTVPVGNFYYQRPVVARYSADGQLDNSFGMADASLGHKGYIVTPSFYTADDTADYLTGFALTNHDTLSATAGDDRITLVGYTFARSSAFIGRLTADGQVDATLSSTDPVSGTPRSGQVRLNDSSINGKKNGLNKIVGARIANDGRIVVAGEGGDRGMTAMRFLAAGALDTSFAPAGSTTSIPGRVTVKVSDITAYDEPSAIALQANGKILLGGYATVGNDHAFFISRLNTNGTPDATYGDGQGRAVVQVSANEDSAVALEVEPSGNAIAGGFADSITSKHDFALLRLIGDPDRLFFDDVEVHF